MNYLTAINNADDLTVSKLITRLRSAFQEEEFQEVEGILSARENNFKTEIAHLKGEIAHWKEKFGALERKHGEVALAKLQVESKLHENEHEFDELSLRVTRLEESIDSMLRQVGSKKKVAESAPEKQPAEMKKSSDNDKASENEAVSGIGGVKEEPKSSENGGLGSSHGLQERGPRCVITKCSNAVPSLRPLDFKAGTFDIALGTSVAAGRSVSERIIEIDDSDEEIKKCVPNVFASGVVSCDEVMSIQSDKNGRRCNQAPLLPLRSKRIRNDSSSSDDSSSNGSGLHGVDRLIASLDKRARQRTSGRRIKWTSEVEMATALIDNEVLRMSAVCALYRELNCNVKSASSLSIKGQVEQSDALSIAKWGKYLSDGDPQGRLKKTVQQLKHYDPEGQNICYVISLKYSNQLFEIYKKGNDPFFPPS